MKKSFEMAAFTNIFAVFSDFDEKPWYAKFTSVFSGYSIDKAAEAAEKQYDFLASCTVDSDGVIRDSHGEPLQRFDFVTGAQITGLVVIQHPSRDFSIGQITDVETGSVFTVDELRKIIAEQPVRYRAEIPADIARTVRANVKVKRNSKKEVVRGADGKPILTVRKTESGVYCISGKWTPVSYSEAAAYLYHYGISLAQYFEIADVPVDATPEPIDATPEPIDATPAPIDATPAPVDNTPAFTFTLGASDDTTDFSEPYGDNDLAPAYATFDNLIVSYETVTLFEKLDIAPYSDDEKKAIVAAHELAMQFICVGDTYTVTGVTFDNAKTRVWEMLATDEFDSDGKTFIECHTKFCANGTSNFFPLTLGKSADDRKRFFERSLYAKSGVVTKIELTHAVISYPDTPATVDAPATESPAPVNTPPVVETPATELPASDATPVDTTGIEAEALRIREHAESHIIVTTTPNADSATKNFCNDLKKAIVNDIVTSSTAFAAAESTSMSRAPKSSKFVVGGVYGYTNSCTFTVHKIISRTAKTLISQQISPCHPLTGEPYRPRKHSIRILDTDGVERFTYESYATCNNQVLASDVVSLPAVDSEEVDATPEITPEPAPVDATPVDTAPVDTARKAMNIIADMAAGAGAVAELLSWVKKGVFSADKTGAVATAAAFTIGLPSEAAFSRAQAELKALFAENPDAVKQTVDAFKNFAASNPQMKKILDAINALDRAAFDFIDNADVIERTEVQMTQETITAATIDTQAAIDAVTAAEADKANLDDAHRAMEKLRIAIVTGFNNGDDVTAAAATFSDLAKRINAVNGIANFAPFDATTGKFIVDKAALFPATEVKQAPAPVDTPAPVEAPAPVDTPAPEISTPSDDTGKEKIDAEKGADHKPNADTSTTAPVIPAGEQKNFPCRTTKSPEIMIQQLAPGNYVETGKSTDGKFTITRFSDAASGLFFDKFANPNIRKVIFFGRNGNSIKFVPTNPKHPHELTPDQIITYRAFLGLDSNAPTAGLKPAPVVAPPAPKSAPVVAPPAPAVTPAPKSAPTGKAAAIIKFVEGGYYVDATRFIKITARTKSKISYVVANHTYPRVFEDKITVVDSVEICAPNSGVAFRADRTASAADFDTHVKAEKIRDACRAVAAAADEHKASLLAAIQVYCLACNYHNALNLLEPLEETAQEAKNTFDSIHRAICSVRQDFNSKKDDFKRFSESVNKHYAGFHDNRAALLTLISENPDAAALVNKAKIDSALAIELLGSPRIAAILAADSFPADAGTENFGTVSSMQKTIGALNTMLADANAKIEALTVENSQLHSSNDSYAKRLDELHADIAKYISEIDNLGDALNKARHENFLLEVALASDGAATAAEVKQAPAPVVDFCPTLQDYPGLTFDATPAPVVDFSPVLQDYPGLIFDATPAPVDTLAAIDVTEYFVSTDACAEAAEAELALHVNAVVEQIHTGIEVCQEFAKDIISGAIATDIAVRAAQLGDLNANLAIVDDRFTRYTTIINCGLVPFDALKDELYSVAACTAGLLSSFDATISGICDWLRKFYGNTGKWILEDLTEIDALIAACPAAAALTADARNAFNAAYDAGLDKIDSALALVCAACDAFDNLTKSGSDDKNDTPPADNNGGNGAPANNGNDGGKTSTPVDTPPTPANSCTALAQINGNISTYDAGQLYFYLVADIENRVNSRAALIQSAATAISQNSRKILGWEKTLHEKYDKLNAPSTAPGDHGKIQNAIIGLELKISQARAKIDANVYTIAIKIRALDAELSRLANTSHPSIITKLQVRIAGNIAYYALATVQNLGTLIGYGFGSRTKFLVDYSSDNFKYFNGEHAQLESLLNGDDHEPGGNGGSNPAPVDNPEPETAPPTDITPAPAPVDTPAPEVKQDIDVPPAVAQAAAACGNLDTFAGDNASHCL